MRLEIITGKPDGNSRPTPLLFVHGGWHGAWCWENFQSYFAEQGYTSYALSLRGHGTSEGRERLRWVRASEFVADVAHVVDQMPRSPVLIGHSIGGYLIQKHLESHSAPGAVLLASWVQSSCKLFYRMARRHPWQTAKAHLTVEPYAYIETPDLAREYFFSPDIPPEKLNRYFALLQTDSYLAGWDTVLFNLIHPERVHNVPMLVLGAGNDQAVNRDEVEATASAYNVQAEFFPGMAHDMMLEKDWLKCAERIKEWLREKDI